MGIFGSKRKRQAADQWPLDMELFRLSKEDPFRLIDALQHVVILGGSGSGKTSASGRLLALSYLSAGFGGVVLCVKPEERQLWERYCRLTGRLDDLIVFDASGKYRFDTLDFEVQRQGPGAGLTENVVNRLSAIAEAAERFSGKGNNSQNGEQFWKDMLRRLERNSVDLIMMAESRVTIPDLYRIVISAPTSLEQARSPEWRERSYCFKCLGKADGQPKTARQKNDFELVADYFLLEWPNIAEKTRSVVAASFTSVVDTMNRGLLKELFCSGTNIDPTAAEDGKILLIDLPVKEYLEVGLFAQIIWKHAFMKSIERRDVRQSPRPVFLWQDEGQITLTSEDQLFLTTARSARVANVMLTQSISTIHAAMGGKASGESEANSLLGNFALKVMHSNGDSVTNQWAADLIGRCRQFTVNMNQSHESADVWAVITGMGQSRGSSGVNEIFEHEVQAAEFTRLRTGGAANRLLVDGIVFSSGRCFRATGRPWMRCIFSQKS